MFKDRGVSVPFLGLCFILQAGVSSTSGLDYFDPANKDNSNQERWLIEEHIRNDIEQKFSVFGYIIAGKMTEMENNIISKLQQYIDEKLDKIESKITNKLDETLNQNVLESSGVKEQFNNLKITIDELEKTTSNNSQILSVMDTVLLDNVKLLNLTSKVYGIIGETKNITIENSLILKSLQNATVNNGNKTNEINKVSACQNKINESTIIDKEFQEVRWNECKEEKVKDIGGSYNFSVPLLPLAEAKPRNVSESGGRITNLHMRVGVRADHCAAILLSPEREPKNTGFHFKIVFKSSDMTLYVVDGNNFSTAEIVHKSTNLSYTNAVLVYIQISDDTLKVRHDSPDNEPLMTHHDTRFGTLKYFGFDSYSNSKTFSTFLYGC